MQPSRIRAVGRASGDYVAETGAAPVSTRNVDRAFSPGVAEIDKGITDAAISGHVYPKMSVIKLIAVDIASGGNHATVPASYPGDGRDRRLRKPTLTTQEQICSIRDVSERGAVRCACHYNSVGGSCRR